MIQAIEKQDAILEIVKGHSGLQQEDTHAQRLFVPGKSEDYFWLYGNTTLLITDWLKTVMANEFYDLVEALLRDFLENAVISKNNPALSVLTEEFKLLEAHQLVNACELLHHASLSCDEAVCHEALYRLICALSNLSAEIDDFINLLEQPDVIIRDEEFNGGKYDYLKHVLPSTKTSGVIVVMYGNQLFLSSQSLPENDALIAMHRLGKKSSGLKFKFFPYSCEDAKPIIETYNRSRILNEIYNPKPKKS